MKRNFASIFFLFNYYLTFEIDQGFEIFAGFEIFLKHSNLKISYEKKDEFPWICE